MIPIKKKGTFHFCYLDFYYEIVKLLDKWLKNHKVYKRMHYKTIIYYSNELFYYNVINNL